MARPPRPDAEKSVSVSLRIPCGLYDEVQARAQMRRTTLTALMLEGLRLCLATPVDPREVPVSQSITALQEWEALIDARVQRLLTTYGFLPAPATSAPSPQPPDARRLRQTTEETASVLQDGNAVMQHAPLDACPPFDPAKLVLGRLCPQRHEWGTTGQTLLRLRSRTCPTCANAARRQKRKATRQAASVE